jgi:transposase
MGCMSAEKATPITSAHVPDLDVVRTFITDMIARGAIVALIAAVVALLGRMRDLNTELMAKLANKTCKRPPSETMRRLQLELPLFMQPAANDAEAVPTPPVPPVLPAREKKKRGPKIPHKHGRPVLPGHLPRVPEVHPVSASQRMCPLCNIPAETIGYKTAEKLDIRPAEYVVKKISRETCSCQKCHEYVVTAPKEDEVLDRGILGTELLVHAIVDHYDDAVPWERMERNARQQDVPLSANTLAGSAGRVIDLFDPVVQHIAEKSLTSSYTALDATSMPVIDDTQPLGIRTGALWLIEGAHLYSYFVFAPSGHAKHIDDLLAGRTLASVMCDGSPTNNCVERAGGERGGCNAHARRGLVLALRGGDARAAEGIDIFGGIFHADAESKRLGETLAERFARRQTDTAAPLERLRVWVAARRLDVEPKSLLGKALGYIERQWKRLTAFMRDPLMDLTNNEVERDLRRWVLDRKTWMFVGHDVSARRAADALTILTTCRKFGIEPRRYLRETLAKILAGEKDIAALLPETYARATAEAKLAAELAAELAAAA